MSTLGIDQSQPDNGKCMIVIDFFIKPLKYGFRTGHSSHSLSLSIVDICITSCMKCRLYFMLQFMWSAGGATVGNGAVGNKT